MPTTEYDISRAFKRIENDLIDSMMRNLKRHRAEEDELGIKWEQWQALQLKELERYRAENAEKFSGEFTDINRRINEMLNTTYNDAQTEEERKVLEHIKQRNFTPTISEVSFFNLNDEKLNVLLERTQADFTRAEYAVLRRANDAYRRVIFDAQVYANVTNDYNRAVDMATHDFLKSGLQSIQYKNGARHNISDYARMAIRTTNKRAYLMGEGNAHDKFGIHTVRVNRRTQACPLCVGYLGKVLIDDVYSGGTAKEASELGVPTLSSAMQAGFLHPNCKDIYSLYIDGISQPAKPWTQQEINDIVGDYNEEQAINHAVDMATSYARMAKYALDPLNAQKYQARADNWAERVEQIKRGEFLVPQAKMPDIQPIPPTYHDGIREFIEVEYDDAILHGIIPVEDGILTIAPRQHTDEFADASLSKRIVIPWKDLSKATQKNIEWFNSDRYGKDFIIQKKDIDSLWTRKTFSTRAQNRLQPLLNKGYKYIGDTSIFKYKTSYRIVFLEKDRKLSLVIDWNYDERKAIKKDVLDAITKREKKVSKELWQKGIRFRDLTARQGDDWVKAMTEFHTAVEADRPVTLVSKAEYDMIKREELYRGIAPVSHLRGDISMTKTPYQCGEQLMLGGVGDCFPSRGVYGDVVAYLSNSTQTAFNYATGYKANAGGCIARMKIKEDAKVISYEDARELFNAIADTHADDGTPYFSRKQRRLTNDVEVGKAMQMLGYDAIFEEYGDGADVHFYMILNRDAIVAIKDEWALVDVISDAQLRRGHI